MKANHTDANHSHRTAELPNSKNTRQDKPNASRKNEFQKQLNQAVPNRTNKKRCHKANAAQQRRTNENNKQNNQNNKPLTTGVNRKQNHHNQHQRLKTTTQNISEHQKQNPRAQTGTGPTQIGQKESNNEHKQRNTKPVQQQKNKRTRRKQPHPYGRQNERNHTLATLKHHQQGQSLDYQHETNKNLNHLKNARSNLAAEHDPHKLANKTLLKNTLRRNKTGAKRHKSNPQTIGNNGKRPKPKTNTTAKQRNTNHSANYKAPRTRNKFENEHQITQTTINLAINKDLTIRTNNSKNANTFPRDSHRNPAFRNAQTVKNTNHNNTNKSTNRHTNRPVTDRRHDATQNATENKIAKRHTAHTQRAKQTNEKTTNSKASTNTNDTTVTQHSNQFDRHVQKIANENLTAKNHSTHHNAQFSKVNKQENATTNNTD